MNDKLAAIAAGQGTPGNGRTGSAAGNGSGGGAGTPSRKPADPPSKPWFGGMILSCLTLAAVWVLTYTLAPLPGQRSLGGWNYVGVGALLTAFISLSKAWQGEPPQRSTGPKGS